MAHSQSEEVFISVDIKTDGPIPGKYSMLSLGAVIIGEDPWPHNSAGFHARLKPISHDFEPEATEICRNSGLDRFELIETGENPTLAMINFSDWINQVSNDRKPVFVGLNAAFDWQFINWYFHTFLGENPFGQKPLDICAYYMGKFGVEEWEQTGKTKLKLVTGVDVPHTHDALEDASEQAKIFSRLLSLRV